ncbi:MAG: sulfatase-like hydrolase/transferase [Cyclobacteriaceae bacterium]
MAKHILLTGLLTILLFTCKQKEATEQPPNIIIMLADDLGYNDVSVYRNQNQTISENASTSQTPNLDKLAQEGIYFTNYYSGAAVCSPSRAALLTGRNKTRLGIYNWIPANVPMHLKSEEVTIAEMLKGNGYSTAHFGKWHLTSANMPQPEPLDQGFDYAFWTHNNAVPSHENPTNFIRGRTELGDLQGYSSHLVVEETMDWLDRRKEKDKPFFLNLWFHESHRVEAAPDSLKNRHPKNQAYFGCIENMDYAIGKLMIYFKQHYLDQNTLILFTSDNGSQYVGSNDPLRGEKCLQFEGGIRVPFIANWKGKIPPGRKSDAVGHFTDVLPTLAAFTGSQVPQGKNIDGENLSDVLLGKIDGRDRNEPLFFYRYFHDPICMLRQDNMILLGYQNPPKDWQQNYDVRDEALFKPSKDEPRWGQWSFQQGHMEALLKQQPKYFELYNIESDIRQKVDISQENQELTNRLKAIMFDKRKEMVVEGGNWYNNK